MTIVARPGIEMSQAVNLGYYAPVLYGKFNAQTGMYEWSYDENHTAIIPAKLVARTVQRLKDGHTFETACVRFGTNRDEAAYMLANADQILKDINGNTDKYPSVH